MLVKLAVIVQDPGGQATERFIVEPNILTSQLESTRIDVLELEAQLRGVLMKLQYAAALLPPLPHLQETTWTIIVYTAGRGGLSTEAWVQEQPPLAPRGLELEDSLPGEIMPIRSFRIQGVLQLQAFIEMSSQPP